jgi:hypothetical protein
MSNFFIKPINLVDEAGKVVASKIGVSEMFAPVFSIAIGVGIFLTIVIIYNQLISKPDSVTSNFTNLITPKGEIPYTREFAEMPIQTAADVSLYKNGKCLCNSAGACDFCLDSSMEERTDHINHMMNRRPRALYKSVSQQRDNVVFDIDKNNLDYKMNNSDR